MRKVILYLFFRYLMHPFLRVIVGVNFWQNESLKKEEQFIIVANHNSHADTAVILSALPSDKIINTHPVAASSHFRNPIVRFLVKNLFNAVFIKRASAKSIITMQELIDQGKSLIIYPEGTRGGPEQVSKLKKGVAVLLKNNPSIPFIPIYLSGMGRILPKDDGLVVPFNSKIVIGDAYKISSNDPDLIIEDIYQKIIDLK